MRVSSEIHRRWPRSAAAFGIGVAVLALLSSGAARAAADCAVSTTGVVFGNYDPLVTANTDSTGEVIVVCTHVSGGATQVNYTVALSAGSSGNYAQRQMRAGDRDAELQPVRLGCIHADLGQRHRGHGAGGGIDARQSRG